MRRIFLASLVILFGISAAIAADGNRLAYLDDPLDPYYPHRDFPKLITPQWVGEPGVECVVTLAIDDMRDTAKYEAYLRPILERLKKIDGRAPVSIMTCKVDPADPQLQTWLKEGLSLECHTFDHPCPCLQDGGLAKAKETYDKCVDLMNQIPGNKPVAFRTPCCDSKNTPSPRLWAEVFSKTTEKGNFLQIDSSVMNIITSADKTLPEEITTLDDGSERFLRYVPFKNFVNTIRDYPYPYVIGGTCWEFPCVTPSDWSAQHVQRSNNPDTVRDWKLALDAAVLKQGTFNLIFHPHGWIRADQIIELIDHAVTKHGKKVKFLNFRECAERLNRTFGELRNSQPRPHPQPKHALPSGVVFNATQDTGLRFVDVNGDGQLDCLFSNAERYSLHLFKDMKEGWSIKVIDAVRGMKGGTGRYIPPIVRADGTNNGVWFHSGALWVQNEETWRLPDGVDKVTFAELLGKPEPAPATEPPPTPDPRPDRSSGPTPQSSRGKEPGGEGANRGIDVPPPKSPDEALRSMHLRPGMKIELVAAEPLVVDPVAFDWGPDGRLWVVEMRDYPNGITWKKPGDEVGKPGGRVKVLTDTNGDGRYDKGALFLDEIPFPTGVKVWRKGIIVTAAPDIFYAEDTTGDDVADERKVLYRGFGEGNQQHRVNGLRWGLDGWLYVGNGDSGGVIKAMGALQSGPLAPRVDKSRAAPRGTGDSRSESPTLGGTEINVAGRDLRIRPDTGEIDAQSGQTQFGRERDDWGNWFGGNNSNPMWHYVLEDHYLRRNPHFAPPAVRKDVPQSPGAAPVFPRSITLTRFNDPNKANRFSSACSPLIYRDDLLGPEFAGNSFVCEPVHNLVHREIVSPQGVSFTSRRADDEQGSEFLASDDNWFRPSMVRTGPDGALWISDMYRFVIEHPQWIPADFQQKLDLRAGDDRGRIYRIYHQDRPPRPIVRLDNLDTAGLVAALDSPNGQQRDLVQQMLIWSGNKGATEPLAKLAANAPLPQVRSQALWTLEQLGSLSDQSLLVALGDEYPGARRQAVLLAEPRLAKSAALAAAVAKLAGDEDRSVRLQVAYSLGETTEPAAITALSGLLSAGENPYLTAAATSSIGPGNVGPLLARVLAAGDPPAALVENLLAVAAGAESNVAVRDALDAALLSPQGEVRAWQLSAVAWLLETARKRKADITQLVGGNALASLRRLQAESRQVAAGAGPLPLRLAAIRLVGQGGDSPADIELLQDLLGPRSPGEVQAAAVASLARVPGSQTPTLLLAGWTSHTPAVRQQILDLLASREDWSLALLDAIERGQLPASQIDASRRQQFATAKSERLRHRAEQVLAVAVDPNRQKLVETYLQAARDLKADAARGKAVFAKRCANCHKLEGAGHAVGPDLTALTNRSPEALLTAILDPNRAVEDKFLDFAVLLADGRTATGMLREETGTSITLAGPEGKTTTILRSEIEQLKSSGKSLMPEGVERDLPAAEMADLVVYLRASGPPPKQLAGNKPELVKPYFDGSVRLFAMHARVYGPKIVYEEKYRNLGYWSSPEDHAAWSFESPGAGEYRVTLDYACANESAGNRLVLTVAGQTLSGAVEGTGSWDDYRSKDLGAITLPAGQSELLVRSDGAIKGALIDLRGIRLAPVKK